MSLARTPQGQDKVSSLSRANNDERRWFANVHQRFQVYIRRAEAIRNNKEATVEQYDELIMAIHQSRVTHSTEWNNMHTEMMERGREEAAAQTQARWAEFLEELKQAADALVEARQGRAHREGGNQHPEASRGAIRKDFVRNPGVTQAPQQAEPTMGAAGGAEPTGARERAGEGDAAVVAQQAHQDAPMTRTGPEQMQQQGNDQLVRQQPPQESGDAGALLQEIRMLRDYVAESETRLRLRLGEDQRRQIDKMAVTQAQVIRQELERERDRHLEETRSHKLDVLRLQEEIAKIKRGNTTTQELNRGRIRNNEYCPREAEDETDQTEEEWEQHRRQENVSWNDPFQQQHQATEADIERLFPTLMPELPREAPAPTTGFAPGEGRRPPGSGRQAGRPGAHGTRGSAPHPSQQPPMADMATRQEMERNPVMHRYLRHFPTYGQRTFENPYVAALEDEDDEYYRLNFPYPFNAPPRPDAQTITDYKKIEGLVPKFSGKESDFGAWISMFIPNVHRARCSVGWKATLLYKAIEGKDEHLANIREGAGATAEDYARTITRLVRTYMHPQGLLADRVRALTAIKRVRHNDTKEIQKWHLRLEQLSDTAISLGRSDDLLTMQLYEDNFNRMDEQLARRYLGWVRQKKFPKDTITILTWLSEEVEDIREFNRQMGQPEPQQPPQSRQMGFLTRRERDSRSPRVQKQRYQRDESTGDEAERVTRRKPRTCPMDGLNHGLAACDLFKGLTPQQRRNRLREWRRCYSCLAPGHNINACNRGIVCAHCVHNHHTLIHGSGRINRVDGPKQKINATTMLTQQEQPYVQEEQGQEEDDWSQDSAPETEAVTMKAADPTKHTQVALQTIPVDLYSQQRRLRVNLLMDPGATGAFMSKRAAERLELQGYAVKASVTGFGGKKTEEDAVVAKLQVAAMGERKKHWLQVQIMEDPAASYLPFNWKKHQHWFEHLRNLPLKEPVEGPVEIMIGMEAPHLVSSLIQDVGGQDKASPVARFTRLGWVVGGPTGVSIMGGNDRSAFVFFSGKRWQHPQPDAARGWKSYHFSARGAKDGLPTPIPVPEDARAKVGIKERDDMMHVQVARMWEVDVAMGKAKPWGEDDQLLVRLKEELTMENGKYLLPTLWKEGHPRIGNNYRLALDRLKALMAGKKLRDPEAKRQYQQQLQQLEEQGYVELVHTNTPETDQANYLPHFPVIRWEKQSTQVRLIMDGAAKYGKQLSLNDCLYKGPKLINELITVLMRFRMHNVTLAADVKKMFFQIGLHKRDRDYHRYLWYKEADSEVVAVYRWKVHPFGSAASPCVAMFTIKQHASKWRETFPRAAETVIHSTLVDDNMDSVPTVEEAKELGNQLIQLYAEAGMELGKVVSNSKEVLGIFPRNMVAPSLEVADLCTKDLQLPLVKALGVFYISSTDEFSFKMERPEGNEEWTKRKILRHEARLYDPHGLISPHTVRARIILQKLWRAGVGWDESIPPEVEKEWKEWLLATDQLPAVRIPRCLHEVGEREEELSRQIHIFCDASGEAYAAAAYVRSTNREGRHTIRLMMSRGKVAPLHLTSIPRLELLSAEMALDIKHTITNIMAVKESDFWFWTDSTNVLCWLKADSRILNTLWVQG